MRHKYCKSYEAFKNKYSKKIFYYVYNKYNKINILKYIM